MARPLQIKVATSAPSRGDLRKARNAGRRDALVDQAPTPPYRQKHAADRRALIGRNDAPFHKIGADSHSQAQDRERTRVARDLEDARLPNLEAARVAAGSFWRAALEVLLARGLQGFVMILDWAGAMILMQRVQVPLGLPPNEVRWAGAFALGSVIAILPAWAARSLEDWRLAMDSDDSEQRRTAASRRHHVIRRATGLILVPLLVVGLIGYARATAPDGLAESSFDSPILVIPPLSWEALVLLGLVGIAVAFGLEWFLGSRRGAHEAHGAVVRCHVRRTAAANRVRNADNKLRKQAGDWTTQRAAERQELHTLSARNRALEDAWIEGAAPLRAVPPRVEPVRELEPVAIRDGVTTQAREVVQELEHAAANLLWSIDPYAVVLPRRDLPPVLAGVRQMVGVDEVRGG